MHYYAAARIEWFLLVEPDQPSLSLYRLDGDRYIEHGIAKPGVPLLMEAPIKVEIDPGTLLSRY
jgi:hypothetical protein